MTKVLLWLIQIYRKFISPLKGKGTCRFYPTCSAYAYDAIRIYGPFKGTFLSLKRILKCHPFHKGGYDPIERRGE